VTDGRLFAAAGAGLGLVGVAAGAFGAHFLESRLAPDLLAVFHTAVDYQMYHALGLLVVGGLSPRARETLLYWAGIFFVAGTIVFSGSLYALALTGMRWLGAVTPVGGVLFLAGWGTLCWSLVSRAERKVNRGGS
jgi:uncharacterized membrane protein YgdD (TMEM256/DUF423 family)